MAPKHDGLSASAERRDSGAVPTRPRAPRARILVIDDDPSVLRSYRRLLGSRHDVVLASGGAAGLAELERDRGFDVVLCDVMMPEVDGPAVYAALAERAPALLARLVFCSGGAFTRHARAFLAGISNPLLDKPVEVETLERAIEAIRRQHGSESP